METIHFKDFNLKINLTNFINVIGPKASGKTTFLKMLSNNIYNENIYIDYKNIHSYDLNYLKKNIAVVFNDLNFNKEYVKEELVFYQEKAQINKEEAYNNLNELIKYFSLEEIIEAKVKYLIKKEQVLIKILSFLVLKPKLLGIDDLFTYLDKDIKLKIIKYAEDNNICILNITTDSEDLLLGSHIVILNKFKMTHYDETNKILNNERLLLSIGYDQPFIINISNGLNYYDLIKETYYKNIDLVEDLWK